MNQTVRVLVMAAISYIAYLAIVRIAMGSQYKSKSFQINIIGILAVFGGFILKQYNGTINPPIIYYILIILLIIFIPPLSLKMKSDQTLKYCAFVIVGILVLHLIFSLFLGWGDIMPFFPIRSIWGQV